MTTIPPSYVTMYLWSSLEENNGPPIRCEIGSNGLHDSMAYYHWVAQEQRHDPSLSSQVYVYHGIQHSADYVGPDLLEVITVPYLVRTSSPQKWEQLGHWNRIIVPWGHPLPSGLSDVDASSKFSVPERR